MLLTITFALLVEMGQMPMPPAQPHCQVADDQLQMMLATDYDTFDQNVSSAASWRPLVETGCYSGAATAIEKYLEAHRSLTGEQIRTLYFHAGPTWAFADQNPEAIRALEHAKDSAATPDWNVYVDATVAFLKHDRAALVAARNAYAKISKPNSARLGVIEGLLNCLGKSYKDGVGCSPRRGGR